MIQRYTPCPESSNLRLNSLFGHIDHDHCHSSEMNLLQSATNMCSFVPYIETQQIHANAASGAHLLPVSASRKSAQRRTSPTADSTGLVPPVSVDAVRDDWDAYGPCQEASAWYIYIYSLMCWDMSRTSDSPERRKPIGPDFARSLLQNLCIIKHLQV